MKRAAQQKELDTREDISINRKICLAFNKANELADRVDWGEVDIIPQEHANMVYGHADGLTAKYLRDMRYGRCSIAASIAFDPEVAEKKLDADLLIMEGL